MKFELVATDFFVQQIEDMDQKSKKIIKDKIDEIFVLSGEFCLKISYELFYCVFSFYCFIC